MYASFYEQHEFFWVPIIIIIIILIIKDRPKHLYHIFWSTKITSTISFLLFVILILIYSKFFTILFVIIVRVILIIIKVYSLPSNDGYYIINTIYQCNLILNFIYCTIYIALFSIGLITFVLEFIFLTMLFNILAKLIKKIIDLYQKLK